MNLPKSLMQPTECALLMLDFQAGLAFGFESARRQEVLHNAIALARTAVVFALPIVVSTSASKVYSGPLFPSFAGSNTPDKPDRAAKPPYIDKELTAPRAANDYSCAPEDVLIAEAKSYDGRAFEELTVEPFAPG